jgi:cobalt-precorrin 5A hydrolase/precorrin-3B C17-methyltransferase
MKNSQRTHKRIALVVLTRAGLALALHLQRGLAAEVDIYANQRACKAQDALIGPIYRYQIYRYQYTDISITSFDTVVPLLSQLWTTYDQIVLFFALGAVVRLIAPLLRHKHQDPGIVAIDDAGQFAISVVSGHIGDANGLARCCAELLGATPVVTTASDVHHTLAVDLLAQKQGWFIEDTSALTAVSAAIVNREPVAILQDCGELEWWGNDSWPDNLIAVTNPQEARNFAALLVIADRLIEDLPQDVPTLVCRPPTLVLGMGCRRGVPFSTLETFVKETLAQHRIAFYSIAVLATADIKADEEALQMLAQHYGWRFETHTVESLKTITTIPNPSERVQRLIGTPSVSEAAAQLSSHRGELIVPKQKSTDMTLAIARKRGKEEKTQNMIKKDELERDREPNLLGETAGAPNNSQEFAPAVMTRDHTSIDNASITAQEQAPSTGHLAIIGLGPGSRDMMAPRAIQMLQACDTVIGYKLYIEQIRDLLVDKEVHLSELRQEVERATLAVQLAWNGHRVCIVSSGDAGIYGMAGLVLEICSSVQKEHLDDTGPEVEVVPGISALNAAAALLGAPLMHDFAVISLSDLLTPWDMIARRLSAVSLADFVIVLYNPISRKRHWQLGEARRLMLESRSASTPVGLVRNAYRAEQRVTLTTLEDLLHHEIDMFTTIVIGNSCTYVQQGRMITPRGYNRSNSGEEC